MSTCNKLVTERCVVTEHHHGPCRGQLAASQQSTIDDLVAQLAQARGSKESAMAMSEQNLARALRAEDLVQFLHENREDGTLPAALDRAEKAEGERDLARQQVQRQNGIINAVIDPKTDSNFTPEQNHYRLLAIGAVEANGWVGPTEVAALKASAAMATASLDQLKANGWLDPAEADALKRSATSIRVGDAIDRVNQDVLLKRVNELDALCGQRLAALDDAQREAKNMRVDRDEWYAREHRARERLAEAERELGRLKAQDVTEADLRDRADSAEWKLQRALEKIEAQEKDSGAVDLYRSLQDQLKAISQALRTVRPP
ncbi:MAG: hypothetical protein WC986_14570, partial [Elusimicrobiota bacterium]